MWIPYDIRGSLKAESAAETIRLSRADESVRDFLVGFFVRNPVTQSWELDIVATSDGEEITAPTTGGQMLPLRLYGNDSGKLSEVIIRAPASSAEAALALAHDALNRWVLRQVVETGRGMAIAGWRIADNANDARWRCTPFRPSALQLNLATQDPLDADLMPVVELFQRARNAPDAASRMLAAYAVLAAASDGLPALAGAVGADFAVTQEMLIHAGAMDHVEEFKGLDLYALVAALKPQHDRLIAPGGMLAALGDDLPRQKHLARLANLADLAAHRLILSEMRARRQGATTAAIPGAAPNHVAEARGAPSC
ncbi:methylamine utilization protein MauJ [Paracoccus sulfuroxidans]|uniref:Methylamine utilization protein MauJ n=1 Tax=Paracoccus sulfuroxidans TaxID=384678 RepID=A0A562NSW8_9RHOB|nr:methylamine utilization protein MauJ [Paracoccus sulfuroxidans]TWI35161.1 hypothetical protein IQ24_01670 [Paracoccus sulfuroxidans]